MTTPIPLTLNLRRPQVRKYLEALSLWAASQTAVAEVWSQIKDGKEGRLKQRGQRFLQSSVSRGRKNNKIEAAVLAFVQNEDVDAYLKARGCDELLAPIDDIDSDAARLFAERIRACDRAGAAFLLAHKEYLRYRRSQSLLGTAEAMGTLDAELTTALAQMERPAIIAWASVCSFPVWNELFEGGIAPPDLTLGAGHSHDGHACNHEHTHGSQGDPRD